MSEDKLAKLAKKRQDLLEREKLIKNKEREREKKIRIKKSADIGKLACKANIDGLDTMILLGAFIEIAHRSKDNPIAQKWKLDGENFLQQEQYFSETPLSVCFSSEINDELKEKMKTLKFKWNKFRKEFYGYGSKQELESLLSGIGCTIEVLQ